MVFCVALNCNTRSGQGISLYTFPKEDKRLKIWTQKVKRKDFVPSKHSRLCAKHFESSQFATDPVVLSSLNFKPKQIRLCPDAVPTVFNYERPERESFEVTERGSVKRKRRHSTAIEKRQKLEVLASLGLLTDGNKGNEKTEETNDDMDMYVDDTDSSCTDAESPSITTSSMETSTQDLLPVYDCGSQTSYNLISRRHARVQTSTYGHMKDNSAQTDQSCGSGTRMREDSKTCQKDTASIISDQDHISLPEDDPNDPDWLPQHDDNDEDYEFEDDAETNVATERKFIVFESQLDNLFTVCRDCGGNVHNITKKVMGTYVHVEAVCSCGNSHSWGSQPTSGTMPWGNLIVAGAIMFSGSSPGRAHNMMKHAGIQVFSLRTYNYMQTAYLVPSIESLWQQHQNMYFEEIKTSGRHLKLGGDARCCSPGHTAKYGSYSLMDLETAKIVDMQLVQSNEVKSSYHMELEGLKRGLQHLEEEEIVVQELVTDRHAQVKKYVREQKPGIRHWFDVWHVAKGVYKKLEALGKKKGYEAVGMWARSVSNHLYWVAASSGGNGQLVQEKWTSIMNHVANIHEGHGEEFAKCQHGPLEDRAWMKEGSKAHTGMDKIIKAGHLMKDIVKLSPAEQTSSLEAFHKVVCFFAPKSVHFFYGQMKARLYLAALHFNENSMRMQSVSRAGNAQFSISYPKARKGEGIAKEVKVKQTFDYVEELMEELILAREVNSSYRRALALANANLEGQPLPLSKSAERRPKEEIVSEHISRFNKHC